MSTKLPFYIEDSGSYKNHKKINIDKSVYDYIGGGITGSFNILFARIWGLSYPDFLRYVRDKYNATLHGKNRGYITFSFDSYAKAQVFQLDTCIRWEIILSNAKIS